MDLLDPVALLEAGWMVGQFPARSEAMVPGYLPVPKGFEVAEAGSVLPWFLSPLEEVLSRKSHIKILFALGSTQMYQRNWRLPTRFVVGMTEIGRRLRLL